MKEIVLATKAFNKWTNISDNKSGSTTKRPKLRNISFHGFNLRLYQRNDDLFIKI